ncbi:hypothetical protein [Comamonas testosteroni]|uniref:Uncharacterized protein n=1 Tax=Comamonas testosteroni TaxID=285 RepID=A0A096GJV8_COMTE|nr:hypothetical protein [Comamonas testosteroni]KGH25450.1 hypothetical protein P353_25080 [Comamonas testosteroni]
MTPAQRVAQHPALAEFCAQQVLAQMAEPLSPEQIRAALAPEAEHQCEAF